MLSHRITCGQSNLESLSNLLLGIGVLHFPRHHGQELYATMRSALGSWQAPVNRRVRGDIPGKSMVPLLSASTSLIMSWSSDSEGFWPRERMTVPSSLVVIWPALRDEAISPCRTCIAFIRPHSYSQRRVQRWTLALYTVDVGEGSWQGNARARLACRRRATRYSPSPSLS